MTIRLNPDAVSAALHAMRGVDVLAHVREAVAELATHAVTQRRDQLDQLVDTAGARRDAVAQVLEDIPTTFKLADATVDAVVLAAALVLYGRQQQLFAAAFPTTDPA